MIKDGIQRTGGQTLLVSWVKTNLCDGITSGRGFFSK